jgi:hypothetical protein
MLSSLVFLPPFKAPHPRTNCDRSNIRTKPEQYMRHISSNTLP